MSAAQNLQLLAQEIGNMTQATSEWIGSKASRMSLELQELASPEAVTGGAAGAATATIVIVGVVASAKLANAWLARRKMQNNALVVDIASCSPEDDGEEHENEQHCDSRVAASGDSETEDDLLPGPHIGKGASRS